MMSSTSDKIANYSIALMALVAVVVSIWQIQILKEHNKLSVKPIMDYLIFTDTDSTQTITVYNKGTGPALITNAQLVYDETTYSSWNSLLKSAGISERVRWQMNFGDQSVLSPDDEVVLIVLKKESIEPEGIDVVVSYESIYEERFSLKFSF